MGSGAIVAVLFLPRLRQALVRDQLVLRGTLLQSGATAVMAFAPNAWVAVPAMFLGGMAWITVANSLSVSAQLALPDWVRARGMSIYQMAIMGASAFGAALWGQVAELSVAATSAWASPRSAATLCMWLALRYVTDGTGEDDDTSPAQHGWAAGPPTSAPGEAGRVVITVEYLIDPARAAAFLHRDAPDAPRAAEPGRDRLGAAARHRGARAATSSRSSTSHGPSTCAASTARPRPTSRCASGGWRSTWARRCRWSRATSCSAE